MNLCSACLLGINCRYDGQTIPNDKVIALARRELLIPVCPEQKTTKVLTISGIDVTRILPKEPSRF